LRDNLLRRFQTSFLENMGMPADHFFADGFHHIFDIELIPVFRNFCVKQDLVKQVSQFACDIGLFA